MATVFFTEDALGYFASNDEDISSEGQQFLESLRHRGVQLGLVLRPRDSSRETVNDVIKRAELFFDPNLTVFNDLSLEQRLREAAAIGKAFEGPTLFVGRHSIERMGALKAGFDGVVPHPRLVSEVLDGGTLIYARVSGLDGDHRDELNKFLQMPMVPVYFTRQPEAHAYVITSARAVELIANLGFEITPLGKEGDPELTDLYLVRDHSYARDEVTQIQNTSQVPTQLHEIFSVLGAEEGGLILALPPTVDIEKIDFAMHDPHSRRLLPAATLLGQLATYPKTAPSRPCLILKPGSDLTNDEVKRLQDLITPAKIETFHAPYVGLAKLVTGGKEYRISSRHIAHDENAVVTNALLEQFERIGEGLLKTRLDPFDLGEDRFHNVEAELPGVEKDSFVIISAHLDSTSNVSDHRQYPAPGGDDDGSGMAAVLAAAEAAVAFTREFGKFKRSLRFVLFNAEEDHILGSSVYATKQANSNAKLEGVFQMDMIGFEGGQKNVFETHAGCDRFPETEICSKALAERVRDMADRVSKPLFDPPQSPQMYPRPGRRDPAQGNSDHARFQEHGYAACMISEDHHPDPDLMPDPPPVTNPDYHQTTDQHINYRYAAEIARAVIAAAFLTAKG